MNRTGLLVIVSVSAGCALFGDDSSRNWGPEIEGYRLSIWVNKGSFACDEPIKLKITVRNSAATAGWFVRSTKVLEKDYPAIVLLPGPAWLPVRQQAALTDEGRRRTDRMQYMGYSAGLFPAGAERSLVLDLNTVYNMQWPGEYSVTVSTQVRRRDDQSHTTLTSNQLKITVEPCKP
jgi:hypothetical protein